MGNTIAVGFGTVWALAWVRNHPVQRGHNEPLLYVEVVFISHILPRAYLLKNRIGMPQGARAELPASSMERQMPCVPQKARKAHIFLQRNL